MNKILIFGATGFIGKHLVLEALSHKLEIHIVHRRTSHVSFFKDLDVSLHTLSFNDEDALRALLVHHKFEYIIQNAGITKAKTTFEYYNINANFIRKLSKIIKEEKLKPIKIIYMSSLAAFGPADFFPANIISDTFSPHPITYYGQSKLQGELYLRASGLPYLILRPTMVYGPGDHELLPLYRIMNKGFALHIASRKKKLSILYVKDLATITIQLILSSYEQKAYFLASQSEISSSHFYEIIAFVLEKNIRHFTIPKKGILFAATILENLSKLTRSYPMLNKNKAKELIAKNWVCDISRLEKDIEFSPTPIPEGMKETIDWVKAKQLLS